MSSIDEAKEIINSTPLSSIISMYVPINKKGGNFEAICPFHSDTNPSLKINDDKGFYKCFVCGAGGDAIKFVEEKLSLGFVDAVKEISSHIGIEIEERKNKNRDPKYDMALRVVQSANKLYRKFATEAKPKHYFDFAKNRNLSEETLQEFQIGYAPANSALTSYLAKLPEQTKDLALKTAEDVGIIRPQNYGEGHYDFYRDRVMFPIWDHYGKVRGFSSRAVLPDQKPKYLNSKESFVFDKGNIMFGFNFAKKHIRENDSVIIVEGNMDVIMLHQFGFRHSVATMGVSLSQQSIKILTNMTKNIYLAMDSDPAGLNAMGRINAEFLEINIIPKFINFNPAKDPDEFLNEFGRLELVRRIEEAPSFIDYQIQQTLPAKMPEKTDEKLKILDQIFKLIAPLKTHLLATEKIIQCAKALGLKSADEDIIQEYKNFLTATPTPRKIVKKPVEIEPEPDMEQEISMPNRASIESIPISNVERRTLETILSHPDCTGHRQMSEILDKMQHFEVKRIIQWVKEIYVEIDESDYPLFLKEKNQEALPQDIRSVIDSSLQLHKPRKLEDKVKDRMMNDLITGIDIQQLKSKKALLREKQRQASTDEEGLEILGEIQELEKELLAFKNR